MEWELAQIFVFENIEDCLKRAYGWIIRGHGVQIEPYEDGFSLYVTKNRICYKKRIAIVKGQLVF